MQPECNQHLHNVHKIKLNIGNHTLCLDGQSKLHQVEMISDSIAKSHKQLMWSTFHSYIIHHTSYALTLTSQWEARV